MRVRRIAVLIDGGFFIKRLSRLVPPESRDTPEHVAQSAYRLCERHVRQLIGETGDPAQSRWLDHVYRLFYYDAAPFAHVAHHPLENRQIDFAKTPEARFREALFHELRRLRKFALRLGKVTNQNGWHLCGEGVTKQLLRTRELLPLFDALLAGAPGQPAPAPTAGQLALLAKTAEAWRSLTPDHVRLDLRQKGVDMRIGLDIAALTLKRHVDTIILVTGDSDFVPAAKVARREGVEFLLDPLWQSIEDDLHEHVDGIVSGFTAPVRAASSAIVPSPVPPPVPAAP